MATTTPAQRELRQDHRTRLDTARLLVDLEEAAFHGDLPVLDWQITAAGLTGRTPFTARADQAQAAFDAWTAHLHQVGEEVETGEHRAADRRVLTTRARLAHPQASTGTVGVVLVAEIDLDEEEA